MTDPEQPSCPRCGTALVAGPRFCPSCGYDIADADSRSGSQETTPRAPPIAAVARPTSPISPVAIRQFAGRVSPGIASVFVALVVVSVLVLFDVVTRPQSGGSITPQGGSAVAPSAPIVGLTIQSPLDGQAVATKEVTVIGLAPPGLTITRDVSFGLDQHGTVDGTGHWAINVGLNEGQNDLVFRIGDDRSTEQRLRVLYTPQAP
jgi:hypothetical protein